MDPQPGSLRPGVVPALRAGLPLCLAETSTQYARSPRLVDSRSRAPLHPAHVTALSLCSNTSTHVDPDLARAGPEWRSELGPAGEAAGVCRADGGVQGALFSRSFDSCFVCLSVPFWRVTADCQLIVRRCCQVLWGYRTFTPQDYWGYFRDTGVSAVIRLNNKVRRQIAS